jgi:dUTP pyrophosphatase
MILRVKRLTQSAILPTKSHETDAGWDLYSPEYRVIEPGAIKRVRTGIAVEIPSGHYGQILGRSGLAVRGVTILGGVIDASYRGEIIVVMANLGTEAVCFGQADRIAQLVILPVPDVTIEEVDELPESSRGVGGFGSSGR